eukprot:5290567-Amphidinium_carterae.1
MSSSHSGHSPRRGRGLNNAIITALSLARCLMEMDRSGRPWEDKDNLKFSIVLFSTHPVFHSTEHVTQDISLEDLQSVLPAVLAKGLG